MSSAKQIPQRKSRSRSQDKEKPTLQRKAAGKTGGMASGMPPVMQRKMALGSSDDAAEKEADRVAKQVVQRKQIDDISAAPSQVQAKTIDGEGKYAAAKRAEEAKMQSGTVQRKPASVDAVQASQQQVRDEKQALLQRSTDEPEVDTSESEISESDSGQINNKRGGGVPLSDEVVQLMKKRMGHDFSHVRVHTDSAAAELAHNMNARAFTIGKDIFFDPQFNPESDSGLELLAHELTHVVQQGPNGENVQRKIVRKEGVKPPTGAKAVDTTVRPTESGAAQDAYDELQNLDLPKN